MKNNKERTKFNISTKTEERTLDGMVFDSEIEMIYYRDIIIPSIKSGDITKVELQKIYILQPNFIRNKKPIQAIKHKVDFYIEYRDGTKKVIDIKGMVDPKAAIKRKMFWYLFQDTEYEWLCYSRIDGGWIIYEDLVQARTMRRKAKRAKSKDE